MIALVLLLHLISDTECGKRRLYHMLHSLLLRISGTCHKEVTRNTLDTSDILTHILLHSTSRLRFQHVMPVGTNIWTTRLHPSKPSL